MSSSSVCRRVESYIKYGWDEDIVDPDGGRNCSRKLKDGPVQDESLPPCLLECLPLEDDMGWTNKLCNLPDLSFSTINFITTLSTGRHCFLLSTKRKTVLIIEIDMCNNYVNYKMLLSKFQSSKVLFVH